MDVTQHGFRAAKTACGDQLPGHRGHFDHLEEGARCRNNLVFQTAMTAKTTCKSSLGQLLATEFGTDAKSCFSFSTFTRHQLARTHLCVDRERSIITSACLSVIDRLWEGWKLPLRRLQTNKRSVCACVPHALCSPNPIAPKHIDDRCA